jgi:hypothetical protein
MLGITVLYDTCLSFLFACATINGAEMHGALQGREGTRARDGCAARLQQGLCYIHHFGGASNGLRIDQLGEIRLD